jgi:hypothetical protein
MRTRLRVAIASLIFATAPLGAAPSSMGLAEIQHLLGHLEHSNCQFYRNGSWHSAAEARAHLDQKFHYFLDKGLIDKAEDFIERAAAASSVSGKPYQVKCGSTAPVTSAQWLTEELQRYRKELSRKKP